MKGATRELRAEILIGGCGGWRVEGGEGFVESGRKRSSGEEDEEEMVEEEEEDDGN
ncbi:hypothetical protein PABG_12676 [Paracoccidioides brasiliensis Pb03]|nr:hypothetical protein PABG_12676 [Paracoccidioides brasiliensis Pb03]